MIVVTEFIEQQVSFLQRPLKEQFEFALAAFKAQESAHATTLNHLRLVEKTFGSMSAHNYLDTFRGFKKKLQAHHPPDSLLIDLCTRAIALLESHLDIIEQYAGFLTHVDFVPHNIRINDGTIFLLDHSALRFGNKYEGWARFINFMTLYNPPLAQALTQYVRDNRTPEELLSLKLMRMYRLGEIMLYYQNTLDKSEGNLQALNTARLHFWSNVFDAVLKDEELPESIRTDYIAVRDSLRSADEKERQVGLH